MDRSNVWYKLTNDGVTACLDVNSDTDLSETKCESHQTYIGNNILIEHKESDALKRFNLQFYPPLTYFFLASAVVTFLLLEWERAGSTQNTTINNPLFEAWMTGVVLIENGWQGIFTSGLLVSLAIVVKKYWRNERDLADLRINWLAEENR